MSKRFRFFLLIVAVGVAALFLYPTVQWYFLYSDSDREQATLTNNEQQRRVGTKAAETSREITALALEDTGGDLPGEYDFLIPLAEERYILDEKPLPEAWTIGTVLEGFSDRDDFIEAVTGHYLVEVEDISSVRSQIIELGLDLAGGVQVVLDTDLQKLRDAIGGEPTAAQVSEAIDLALEVITNRIDRFGVTEPQVRRRDDNTIEITPPWGERPREG